jgi:hypothetical protein
LERRKMKFCDHNVLLSRIYDFVKDEPGRTSHRIPVAYLFPDLDRNDKKAVVRAIKHLITANYDIGTGKEFKMVGLVTKVEYYGDEGVFVVELSSNADNLFEARLGSRRGGTNS